MENQHNKTVQPALLALRQEIDAIDNQIIDLLSKRMEVIHRVGELKKNNQEKFFIRSNREADMIKDLVKRADNKFPTSAIVSIWRKIIASANMHEQPLQIALHNPRNIADYNYLLREYYYDAVPIISHDSTTNVVSEIEKGAAHIGVFALPKVGDESERSDISDNWWIGLANNKSGIKVFAKVPFIKAEEQSNKAQISLVAVAIKPAEQSQEDNSLLYIEVKKEVSRSQILAALNENNLHGNILKSVKLPQVDDVIFYLVDVAGFFTEETQNIQNFTKSKIRPYVKVLGSYATPIKL